MDKSETKEPTEEQRRAARVLGEAALKYANEGAKVQFSSGLGPWEEWTPSTNYRIRVTVRLPADAPDQAALRAEWEAAAVKFPVEIFWEDENRWEELIPQWLQNGVYRKKPQPAEQLSPEQAEMRRWYESLADKPEMQCPLKRQGELIWIDISTALTSRDWSESIYRPKPGTPGERLWNNHLLRLEWEKEEFPLLVRRFLYNGTIGQWMSPASVEYGDDPEWQDPALEYRRKPEPKIVPWTRETCPVGTVVRIKENGNVFVIAAATLAGCFIGSMGSIRHYEDVLERFEQLDGTPCGTEEGK